MNAGQKPEERTVMSVADLPTLGTETRSAAPISSPASEPHLHRLADVRRQQGLTRGAVARRLNVDVDTVRAQEAPTSDLTLRTVYAWRDALDVPVSELLMESDETLSAPVLKRARMVRLMKTASAILERAQQPSIQRMARMLVEQLIEMMPELAHITPWHAVGQRRTQSELGQTAFRRLSVDALHDLFER
jgi:transcriptional regulator with XRE-family HTH domain